MLFVNIPILWFLGREAMAAYHDYFRRLDSGQMGRGHAPEHLAELMRGRSGKP
jgi:hypothetical protein